MKIFILIISFLLSNCFHSKCFAENELDYNVLEITVDAQKIPLKDILNDFSKKTTWTIKADEQLVEVLISGVFVREKIESFFKKALKGRNVSVVYNEQYKLIELRSFGKSGQNQITIKGDLNMVPAYPKQEELLTKHLKDRKAIEEYKNNPQSIEPITGSTLEEIVSSQVRGKRTSEAFSNNPESVEPLTGMTLEQITSLRTKELGIVSDHSNGISPPKEVLVAKPDIQTTVTTIQRHK